MNSSSTVRTVESLAMQWRRKVGMSLAHFGRGSAPLDDWQLWHKAQNGCALSARDLVDQLMPQALGLAMQMLRRREDAQDVVQESFLRLWGSQVRDLQTARLSSYFNAIVINRCKSLLERTREFATDAETLTGLAEEVQTAQSDFTDAPASFSATQLQQAMGTLPARQRMALAMWAYANADAAHIARSMDIEVNAAHQLLHRAKGALRQALQGDLR
jgi:RNA polymerase sigma-70 factor (ECF subfamily)